MSVWMGESYTRDSLTPDDDANYPPKDRFTTEGVSLTVDGRAVVDSTRRRLDCVYFDAVFFTTPVVYPAPDFRYTNDQGVGVYADAAIWVKGLGIDLPPLPPGKHTMHLLVDTKDGYGYDNTWHVTVKPPKKSH